MKSNSSAMNRRRSLGRATLATLGLATPANALTPIERGGGPHGKPARVPLLAILLVALQAFAGAEAPAFQNAGSLAGFTGGNQRAKISENREQDFGGNGASLRCVMIPTEPDTPKGGCHAEAHLARFPDGSFLGRHPGFSGTTVYRVRFDQNCERASVGFFQYKNCGGPEQWNYLVALWRLPRQNGGEIHFQVNPDGKSEYRYAALSATNDTALVPDRWHEVRVTGSFTNDTSGWVEVSINGQPVEWFYDVARKQPVGTRITGKSLPDLPGAEWQLQLGGYGFFKSRRDPPATVFIDDVKVWRQAGVPAPRPAAR